MIYTVQIQEYLPHICERHPIVVQNDNTSDWDKIRVRLKGEGGGVKIDGEIIMPKSGSPEWSADIGACFEVTYFV